MDKAEVKVRAQDLVEEAVVMAAAAEVEAETVVAPLEMAVIASAQNVVTKSFINAELNARLSNVKNAEIHW